MIQSLLQGEQILLTSLDLDRDAETIAGWTNDPEYWNLYDRGVPRPLSPAQIRKKYALSEADESVNFQLAIRSRADDRLLGLAIFHWVDWSNSNAWLSIAIGSAEDRGGGLESDTLRAMLRFAFHELNLYRVQAVAIEYALTWRQLLEVTGFTLEVCRRQEVLRADRAWDLLIYGLLASEWKARPKQGDSRE
jgi:RimJ/RimL family protein N-acetyltransferase